jgi:hypothetical protein
LSASWRGTTTSGASRTAWSTPRSPSASSGNATRAERRVVVHSLAQARAAVAAAQAIGCPVTLASAAGAGAYAGAPWFAAIVKLAAAEAPGCPVSAILDCGDQPGTVLAALRAGVRRVRFEGSAEAASHLGEIAAQYGATIERGAHAPALDLLDAADPEAACRAYLAGNSAGA